MVELFISFIFMICKKKNHPTVLVLPYTNSVHVLGMEQPNRATNYSRICPHALIELINCGLYIIYDSFTQNTNKTRFFDRYQEFQRLKSNHFNIDLDEDNYYANYYSR